MFPASGEAPAPKTSRTRGYGLRIDLVSSQRVPDQSELDSVTFRTAVLDRPCRTFALSTQLRSIYITPYTLCPYYIATIWPCLTIGYCVNV